MTKKIKALSAKEDLLSVIQESWNHSQEKNIVLN